MKLTIVAPGPTAAGLAGSAVATSTQNPPASTAIVPVKPTAEDRAQTAAVVKRDERGRILPGASLNPGGKRPGLRTIMAEVVDFRAVISMVADIAYGKLAPAARMNDRLKAAELLLAYQFGKPTQTLNLDDKTRPPSIDPKTLTTERLNALRATIRASLTDITDAELIE